MTRFFTEKVPEGWFDGELSVESDDEEILCTGELPPPGHADDFRESTRAERMAIAAEAEARFGRKVSWGVTRRGRHDTVHDPEHSGHGTTSASANGPCSAR